MGCKILIVDDSAITRAVLKKTLSLIDLSVSDVSEASNGREALESIRNSPVDLVFADLNMPEMNGMEMTSHIMEEYGSDAPAVVVVTTEASPARITELLKQGIKGYVHKPFTPEQIRDMILEVTQTV